MSENAHLIEQAHGSIESVKAHMIGNVVMENQSMLALLSVLGGGHVMVESEPGEGKTVFANTFAGAIGGSFGRVQGTPDVMPTDFTGGHIFNPKDGDFNFRQGPVFNNVLLIDEFNRNSPKTQSAVLEAMQEDQVTVGGETHKLPDPFMVIATGNPREFGQGVYQLTRANLDRFGVSVALPTQDKNTMLAIARLEKQKRATGAAISLDDVRTIREAMDAVQISAEHEEAIADIVEATRAHKHTYEEGSVLSGYRPFKAISRLARFSVLAAGMGRQTVGSEDIRFAAPYVLGHRIEVSYEALESGNDVSAQTIVSDILNQVRLPRDKRQ